METIFVDNNLLDKLRSPIQGSANGGAWMGRKKCPKRQDTTLSVSGTWAADGIGAPDPNPRNLVNWCY